jgi:hypothetical protein
MGAFDARGGIGLLGIPKHSPCVEVAVTALVKTKQGPETLGGYFGSLAASIAILVAFRYGRPGDSGPLDKSMQVFLSCI